MGQAKKPLDRGRWSSQRKTDVVLRLLRLLRLLRGEDLDALCRELKLKLQRIAQWRDQFLAGGQGELKSREPDALDEEIVRLKAKIGEPASRPVRTSLHSAIASRWGRT